MVLFCRFYSFRSIHGHILRSLGAPSDLLTTLVCIFSEMVFMFYLLPPPGKTLICLRLHLFHFGFHAACFSPHLTGHLCYLLFHIRHLTTGDSSHPCILSSISLIFLALFLKASCCTSSTISLSSTSISAACQWLSRLVFSALSKFA